MPDAAPGSSRFLCPVRCGWHHDAPPLNPAAMEWSAAEGSADISEAISRVSQATARRTASATEAALTAHLDTHTTIDLVTALERLHGQVQQLTEALADTTGTDHDWRHATPEAGLTCSRCGLAHKFWSGEPCPTTDSPA